MDTPNSERETWQWQEPGRAWKGAALYHLTLTVTSRQPVLGTLTLLGNDPSTARVERTPLGDALVDCLLSIPSHHPEVQVLHFCLMPDHLHAVLYVRRTMPLGIAALVRGFWQAAKKLGRAWTVASAPPSSLPPNVIRGENEEGGEAADLREASGRLERFSESLRAELGDEAYYRLAPLFEQMPFIRPMGHNAQLPTTIRYIDMNPQRLATKRLWPDFFRVQRGIEIAGQRYDGVGNTLLLTSEHFAPVHVRHAMVQQAQHGTDQPLRDYKNACVLKAREGCVMVSPFISPDEKQVMQVLLHEKRPFILMADNGFRDYYKPADALFDACSAGLLLILSPWPYDAGKRHVSRADCVALNKMAEAISDWLNAAPVAPTTQ